MKNFQPNRELIAEKLLQGRKPTVAVVGDYCLDQYLYIDADLDEPSVETGLTAFQVRRKALFPGVGGTIANNLAALGANVRCFGLCGDDGQGFELIRELKKIGADTDGMVQSPDLLTGTYTKPMRQVNGVWTELNRLDIRNDHPAPAALVEKVSEKIAVAVETCDAVIVSDQFTREAGSVLNADLRTFLSRLAEKNPSVFFLVDSRSYCERYRGAVVKCNASEILDAVKRCDLDEKIASVTVDHDADVKEAEILAAGRRLSKRNAQPVLITRGRRGAILIDGENALRIPAFEVPPPIDICGAGDATDAALAFGRALGLDLANAAFLAAAVSSITIQQLGVTGTADVPRILERLGTLEPAR